ncbi:hypothetical protein HMPREF9534_02054 [Escherichia coli MS 69-1]|nr:hypothetical protein HMPREF9534_02054 [Escherichia coli MS 69-1]
MSLWTCRCQNNTPPDERIRDGMAAFCGLLPSGCATCYPEKLS